MPAAKGSFQGFAKHQSLIHKMLDLTVVLAVVGGVIFLGSLSVEIINYFAGLFIQRIDPGNYFLNHFFYSLCAFTYTLLTIKLIFRNKLKHWGFNFHLHKHSLKIFFWFCIIYTPVIFVTKVIPDAKEVIASGKSIDAIGIIGSISTHLLMSGLYEETLFRGFIITFLSRSWPGEWKLGKIAIPYTAFWSVLIFMLAHTRWGQEPLFYSWQLGWAAILGIYYAIMFHRTKSLLNPIFSHSYSNAVFVALLIFYSMFINNQ